jgi:hypothetical protein
MEFELRVLLEEGRIAAGGLHVLKPYISESTLNN